MADQYTRAGYADRAAYFKALASMHGTTTTAVQETAEILGQAEDFGMLPSLLRDFENDRTAQDDSDET